MYGILHVPTATFLYWKNPVGFLYSLQEIEDAKTDDPEIYEFFVMSGSYPLIHERFEHLKFYLVRDERHLPYLPNCTIDEFEIVEIK